MYSQPSTEIFLNGRDDNGTHALSQFERRMRVLEMTVQLLIVRMSMGDHWAEGMREAANLLEALPLQTGDFAAINRHLQNAIGYCQRAEFGAATFELRVMRGQLQRL